MTEPREPYPVNARNPVSTRNARPEEQGDHFAAPLGSSTSGKLRFTGGASRLLADLRTADYDDATDHYDITITGGANNPKIERRLGEGGSEP